MKAINLPFITVLFEKASGPKRRKITTLFREHRQPRRVVCGVHLKIEKGENICNSTE